jgi:hypothetical protein
MSLPRRAVIAAAGVLLSAGCASTGRVAAQQGSTTAPDAGRDPFPITAYEPTPTQAAQVKYLDERLTQVCMQGFGFAYAPQLSTGAIAQSVRIDQEFLSRMYGVSDPAAVHEYGYHLPAWTQGSAAPDLVAAMPAAQRSVFEGTTKSYGGQAVPQGGCRAWAAGQLAQRGIDPSSAWPTDTSANTNAATDTASLVAQIQTDAFEQAQSDPRVLAVFGKWSACMRAYGDDYPTPFVAAADQHWATGTPTAREIEVAEHDLACKSRVGLAGVETAVVSGYQESAIAGHAAVLAPLRARLGAAAAAINELMARYRT